jgi:hypothetical protein
MRDRTSGRVLGIPGDENFGTLSQPEWLSIQKCDLRPTFAELSTVWGSYIDPYRLVAERAPAGR